MSSLLLLWLSCIATFATDADAFGGSSDDDSGSSINGLPHTWIDDGITNHEPLFTFDVPTISSLSSSSTTSTTTTTTTYEFYSLSIIFWIELIVVSKKKKEIFMGFLSWLRKNDKGGP